MIKKIKMRLAILWVSQQAWLTDYGNPMHRVYNSSHLNKKNWIKYR